MAPLPRLEPTRRERGSASAPGLVLAVYAPLGTDEVLSVYPNTTQKPIAQQPLVLALQKVAAEGVNVSALVDLFEDDTWLVEIPAGRPQSMRISSTWKQDMSAPQALTGFLCRTAARFPCAALVLAIEGHGGGFVPEIDRARLTPQNIARWSLGGGGAGSSGRVRWVKSEGGTSFEPEPGSPVLPMASPELPMASPELPATRPPMSTWALGEALRRAIKAGVPRPAVIHFNNCFNASVELLHTVAPHADVATGYANYNFFLAGAAYPPVFRRLRLAGSATREQLGQWFAQENGTALAAKPLHPSLGASIALRRMAALAKAIDALAQALLDQLLPITRSDRPAQRERIRQAAIAAQHYDSEPGFELQPPDQFVDIGSFAAQLRLQFPAGPVHAAAAAVLAAMAGSKQYGATGAPHMDPAQHWDFSDKTLGLNILLPDPALQGVWDWRSPYYLSGKVDPAQPPAQRQVIDFLADRAGQRPRWVAFIVEYHREVDFVALLPARPPLFPVFDPPQRRGKPRQPTAG